MFLDRIISVRIEIECDFIRNNFTWYRERSERELTCIKYIAYQHVEFPSFVYNKFKQKNTRTQFDFIFNDGTNSSATNFFHEISFRR